MDDDSTNGAARKKDVYEAAGVSSYTVRCKILLCYRVARRRCRLLPPTPSRPCDVSEKHVIAGGNRVHLCNTRRGSTPAEESGLHTPRGNSSTPGEVRARVSCSYDVTPLCLPTGRRDESRARVLASFYANASLSFANALRIFIVR